MTSDEIVTNTEEAVEKSSGQSYVLQDFSGTYTPKLDEKGRFIIPAKFR